MSELINKAEQRKELLKHLILQLHQGTAPEAVRTQLQRLLGQVPYHEVTEVEQELINEGLPIEEVLKLCDIHTAAMKSEIDTSAAKEAPPGHPADTFRKENRAIEWELQGLTKVFAEIGQAESEETFRRQLAVLQKHIHALTDVDKHYRRKENLLFPILERYEITGPSTVMWGKHDEIRELLKAAVETLHELDAISRDEIGSLIELVFKPTATAIEEMIFKEENILLPMSLDKLTDQEWHSISEQSLEIGYCLYDPTDEWKPSADAPASMTQPEPKATTHDDGRIQLPSGSFTTEELTQILNTIPFDLTFVDRNDTVRYFTQGRERIFDRNRAILGRKVQMCHPPKSVHIVEQILRDFKSGVQSQAPFWIQLKDRFIHIEYFALRDKQGNYLGTLEVSQDLTEKKRLVGEQRLLSYVKEEFEV